MRRPGWTIAFAACIMGTFAFTELSSPVAAKVKTPLAARSHRDTDTVLTTLSGVFSEEQAKRGKDSFASVCLSCHTPSEQSGDAFDQKWNQHTLYDLYSYISQQMPQDNPGSLDPATAADVVAYLLKLNAMPAGTADLTSDTAVMKNIRITRTKGPTP
jgi:mono/diheme cytochrome c family protein